MRALAAVLLLAVTTPAFAADDEVVLLDFTAPYCGPCKAIQPQLNELHRQGYPIRQINISADPRTAAQYKVKFVPTFVLLVNGKERWRDQGTERVGQLKGIMDQARQMVSRSDRRREVVGPGPARSVDPPKPTLLDRMFNRQTRDEPGEPEVILGQEPDKAPDSVTKGAMAASVRIRVTYDGKVQFGSGTIVHSKQGRSIILTCAHIMDQAGPNPKVEVDVFRGGKSVTFFGKVIGHDIKSDVGIITIPTSAKLPVAEVAIPSLKPTKGQAVFSIGCDNGKEPTRMGAKLSGVDRYLGPNNLETNLAPEHGRSGGSLFDSRGRVIGVCSAADRKGNHGLYAGNRAIYEMFKKHKMLEVYGKELANVPEALQKPSKKRTTLFDSDRSDPSESAGVLLGELAEAPPFEDSVPEAESLGAGDSLGAAGSFDLDDAMGTAAESFGSSDSLGSVADSFDSGPSVEASFESNDELGNAASFESAPKSGLAQIPARIHDVPHALKSGGVRSALDELGGDAEVTVIIRPRDPGKSSQIVVIPHATSNFVAMLKGEVDSQPTPTSFVRPVMEVDLKTARQAEAARKAASANAKPILKLHPVGQWIDRDATSDIPRALTGWTKRIKK